MSPGLRVLRSALGRRRRALAAIAAWSALEAVPALVFGRAVANATDAFLARRVEVGLAWLGALALAALVGALGSRQAYGPMAEIVEPLRDDLVRRVVRGTLWRSTQPGAGPGSNAVASLSSQVEMVRDTFAGLLIVVVGFLFTAGAAVVGMLTLAPIAALFVLPPLAAVLALSVGLLRASARLQRVALLADESVSALTSTVIAALRDISACGAEAVVTAEVESRIAAQERASQYVARLAAIRSLTLAVGGWLPLLAMLMATPWLLRRGMSVGALLGMLAYVRGGLQPALRSLVHGLGGSGARLTVALGRALEVGGAPAVPVVEGGSALVAGHGLRMRSVTFVYGPYAEPVLRDLDLAIPEGDHLAVVGPSGIGKSTLAGLLTGMLAPQSGEVTMGGVSLRAFDWSALPRHRVLIPQEAYVFAGTLLENLAYLNPCLGREELDAAVEAVGLGPVRDRLGGYEGLVEPGRLSAGERQLVALVRAYVSRAPIAVLDEATCHLDPGAEARAEEAFARRPGTLVVVAHRVSSALRARRILVLDGTCPTLGSHAELLSTSALYRDLVGYWGAGSAGQSHDAVRASAWSVPTTDCFDFQ